MTQVWQATSTGYEYPGFRVEPIAGPGRYRWRLDVGTALADGSTMWQPASYHRRLGSAQVRAVGLENERLKRLRVKWRMALGGTLLFVSFLAMAFATNLGAFVVAAPAFGLAVRFWFEAAAIHFGVDGLPDAWPRLEGAALRTMDSLRRPTPQPERELVVRVSALPADLRADEHDGPGAPHPQASPMHVC